MLCSAAQGTNVSEPALGMHVVLTMWSPCFQWDSAHIVCGNLPALHGAAQCVLSSVSSSLPVSSTPMEVHGLERGSTVCWLLTMYLS